MRWGIGVGAALFFVGVCCAGCVTQSAPPIKSAVAPGQARLSITRANETSLDTVHIAVNGVQTVDLVAGESYSGGVRAGPVSVTASVSLDLGQYTVRFNAVPGRTYAFEVSKRTERIVEGLVGGMAALVTDTAANGEHSGAYRITPVAR